MKKIEVITFILTIILGIFLGTSIIEINSNINTFDLIFYISVFVLILVSFMVVATIIHELGHLFFGLIAGYKFQSFSLWPITINKVNGKLKFSRLKVKGIAGQCLMSPNLDNTSLNKTILYNLGGGLNNIIFSLMVIILILIIRPKDFYLISLRLLYIANFLMAVMNLYPGIVNGIANDGYNIKMLLKDKNSLEATNNSLAIYGMAMQGYLYTEMPKNLFKLDDSYNYNNPLLAMQLSFKINYLIESKEYKKADEILKDTLASYNNILGHYQNMFLSDKLFFDIIFHTSILKLREDYENLNNIISSPKKDLDSLKIKLAYYKLVDIDSSKYKEVLDQYKNEIDKTVIKVDKQMSKAMLDLINNTKAIESLEV